MARQIILLTFLLYYFLSTSPANAAPSPFPAPKGMATPTTQPPVAPKTFPPGVTLQSLFEVANSTTNLTTSMAVEAYVFLATVYRSQITNLPPCFEAKREESETNINVSSLRNYGKFLMKSHDILYYILSS